MLARTLLNVVIGGVCLMSALTANDYYLSRRLREIEASYNPTAMQNRRPWPVIECREQTKI